MNKEVRTLLKAQMLPPPGIFSNMEICQNIRKKCGTRKGSLERKISNFAYCRPNTFSFYAQVLQSSFGGN